MSHLFRNPSVRTWLAAGLALLVSSFPPPAFAAGSGDGNGKTTVVFVCLHGSVKSQMAAAHFNRIASERGLPFTAVSRGIEVDTSIPTRIRDGLNLDGLAPTDDIPIGLTADEAGRATKVVAFDTVPDERRGTSEVTYWSDVPPATKDYAAARDVIVTSTRSSPRLCRPARSNRRSGASSRASTNETTVSASVFSPRQR
jgi:hypothetical protein